MPKIFIAVNHVKLNNIALNVETLEFLLLLFHKKSSHIKKTVMVVMAWEHQAHHCGTMLPPLVLVGHMVF